MMVEFLKKVECINVLVEEWTRLILEANDTGLSIREIPNFIKSRYILIVY